MTPKAISQTKFKNNHESKVFLFCFQMKVVILYSHVWPVRAFLEISYNSIIMLPSNTRIFLQAISARAQYYNCLAGGQIWVLILLSNCLAFLPHSLSLRVLYHKLVYNKCLCYLAYQSVPRVLISTVTYFPTATARFS